MIMYLKSKPLLYATAFFLIVYAGFQIARDANEYPKNLIWSDMEGYYVYLPATFIYGGFENVAVRDTGYLRRWENSGKIYTKYTCGVALMQTPFFLGAHALSAPLGYPSDGHSEIYPLALLLGAVVYMLLGMWLLYLSLRRYFSLWASVLTLAALLLGTNLYYYSFFQSAMSHVYSFFLFAALVCLTERLLEGLQSTRRQWTTWALLGLVAGLIVLVRPTGIIVLLYPLYRCWKALPAKMPYLRAQAGPVLLAGLMFVLPWIPQFLYWKYMSGDWVMWSYKDESFKYWKEPKLFRVLFDAWNGWLLYSPIAIIPLAALLLGRHSNRFGERGLLLIFAIATYLFASWWAWWFGGAFGHRSYVEYYALLAIPFALVAEKALRRWYTALPFVALCALLCYYSLGLTYNYRAPWDGADWTYERVWQEVDKLF